MNNPLEEMAARSESAIVLSLWLVVFPLCNVKRDQPLQMEEEGDQQRVMDLSTRRAGEAKTAY